MKVYLHHRVVLIIHGISAIAATTTHNRFASTTADMIVGDHGVRDAIAASIGFLRVKMIRVTSSYLFSRLLSGKRVGSCRLLVVAVGGREEISQTDIRPAADTGPF